MTTSKPKTKRAAIKDKVAAGEKRNSNRSLASYARDARDEATSFVKAHPIATVAGGLALGALIAAIVPGPGKRLRKKASKRGALLAGVLGELALTYGTQFLDSAGKAAKSGQDRLGDLGDTLGDGARDMRRSAGDLADNAGSMGRQAGERAIKTLRDLRSRMAN